MRLSEIFEPALYESGHLFAPSFEDLMINERDLRNIARLALRDINKYSHRTFIMNIDMSSGLWVVPADLGAIRSVTPQYTSGRGFRYDAKSRCFTGPAAKSFAVCVSGDWTVSKVLVDDDNDPLTPDVEVTEDQPATHQYLDEHSVPPNLQPVYEILGYATDTLHREDHDKLMAAHFMMVVGRSRENFLMNDSISSPGGASLYDQGKDLRDEAFEHLIESSDQFMGILDDPEFM